MKYMSDDTSKSIMNIRRLRNIRRCNNFPTVTDISVAEHSYNVAVMGIIIAKEYNEEVRKHNQEYHPYDVENQENEINLEEFMYKALIHDLPECMTGDVAWNVKHHNSDINKNIKFVEEEQTERLMGSKWEQFVDDVINCKDGFEGSIVDIMDMLELGIYSWEEVQMGNKFMVPMLMKCIELIGKMPAFMSLNKYSDTFKNLYNMLRVGEISADTVYFI